MRATVNIYGQLSESTINYKKTLSLGRTELAVMHAAKVLWLHAYTRMHVIAAKIFMWKPYNCKPKP